MTGELFGAEEMIVPLVVQRSMAGSPSEVKDELFFIAHDLHPGESRYRRESPFPDSVKLYRIWPNENKDRLTPRCRGFQPQASVLRRHPHFRRQPVPETSRQTSYYFLEAAGTSGLYIPVIMNLIFRSATSTSRTICRSSFQSSTLPNLYLRQASTMQHNVPKLNDPSLFKTNVAYVNGEWVKAKSGKTFQVSGKIMTISALCQS